MVARIDPVSRSDFGKDHWSAFAYIVTRCIDHGGQPNKDHMKTNTKRHPTGAGIAGHSDCPTRLKGYFDLPEKDRKSRELKGHDDWDCLDDLIAAGLLIEPSDEGTGMFPVYRVTDKGWEVSKLLNTHKADGNHFATFESEAPDV